MRKDKGLSIIEVILAVVIISICVIAMASLFAGILRGSPDIKKLTIATALSEEAMERALSKGFAAISNVTGANFSDFPGYIYDVNVFYVAATDLDTPIINTSDYKHVKVMVRYGQNYSRSVASDSLLTNYTN